MSKSIPPVSVLRNALNKVNYFEEGLTFLKIMENNEIKSGRLENNTGKPTSNEDNYIGDDIFNMVVANLKERGLELPHPDIYAFRKMYSGKNAVREFIIVRFRGGSSMHISVNDDQVVAMVGEGTPSFDTYLLTDDDEKKYRDKYFEYAKMFLEERERVLANKSKLGSERLARLGI